jgi:ferredoxin
MEDTMQESPYRKLAEKLDTNIMGAPKREGDFSPAFMEYLELLYTPEEAELAAFLPTDPGRMTAEQIAEEAARPLAEVEDMLAGMAKKRTIFGIQGIYVLPPMPVLLNLHQFREETDKDAMTASRLYQDFFIKDGFYMFYQVSAKGTLRRRTVPVDRSISAGQQVLSHEEIGAFLDRAGMGAMALVRCPCRSRTEKLGTRECKDKYPVASCLVVGLPALLFVERGEGRQVTREEADRYVEEMRELGLVTLTDNAVEMTDGVICFCCGCCCSVTRGLTRWDNPAAFARSNFIARVGEDCEACGVCVERCFFNAIALSDNGDRVVVDENRCMGCGVCTVTCPSGALKLERLEREPIFADTGEMQAKLGTENEKAGQRRPSS